MKFRTLVFLVFSHGAIGLFGFGLGIYLLPILIAPESPSEAEVQSAASQVMYSAEFTKDLNGSDAFHWGEGTVSIGASTVALMGKLSPGPDYKLYFSPQFVEDEAEFLAIKGQMLQAGSINTFDNFIVNLPASVDPSAFNTVVVWCESFGEFITAAQYK